MIKSFSGEKWEVMNLVSRNGIRYAISNFGRLVSFNEKFDDGILLQCGVNKGYKIHRVILAGEEKPIRKGFYLHKLVAEYFHPKPDDDKIAVIHIDFDKSNNHFKNLRWVSKEELNLHQRKNPELKEQIRKLHEHNKKSENGYKLNEAKVKILKRKLLDPKRKTRIKMLARQFGVSEMQLYRIRTGENWGHVSIDR